MTNTLSELRSQTAWLVHVSTDIVVFGIADGAMQVLLRRHPPRRGATAPWALPGGYVGPVEHLDRSAEHTLVQQTGVDDVYLEQLYTFGRPDRHPASRVITVAYYALMPPQRVAEVSARPTPEVRWFAIDAMPDLYLDHTEIVTLARRRLQAKLNYSTIAFQLLPEEFTLSELQAVYETILCDTLDKRNFRKRVLALDCIEETGAKRRDGYHRPAALYRYKSPGKVQYIK